MLGFECLSAERQEAAEALGYSAVEWNGPDAPAIIDCSEEEYETFEPTEEPTEAEGEKEEAGEAIVEDVTLDNDEAVVEGIQGDEAMVEEIQSDDEVMEEDPVDEGEDFIPEGNEDAAPDIIEQIDPRAKEKDQDELDDAVYVVPIDETEDSNPEEVEVEEAAQDITDEIDPQIGKPSHEESRSQKDPLAPNESSPSQLSQQSHASLGAFELLTQAIPTFEYGYALTQQQGGCHDLVQPLYQSPNEDGDSSNVNINGPTGPLPACSSVGKDAKERSFALESSRMVDDTTAREHLLDI